MTAASQHPDDYAVYEALAEWTRKEWWLQPDSKQTRIYSATLDIELAFPSIRLSRLRTVIAVSCTLTQYRQSETIRRKHGHG